MSFELLLSDETRLDIFEAFLWYEEQRTELGFDFELCLEAGLNTIQRNPFSCQIKYDSSRVHFINRFPYGIHYIIEDESIKVFGVFHMYKNPTDWTERINPNE